MPSAAALALILAGAGAAIALRRSRARSGSPRSPTSALSLLYSSLLKHVVILDVLVLAGGFVLRAWGGAVAVNVEFSHWLLLLTLLGGAVSRAQQAPRGDSWRWPDDATGHRRSLAEYSPYLLDQMIGVVTASTLLAYAFYTIDPETVGEVRHRPPAVDGAVSALRDLPIPLSGASARGRRKSVGHAPDRPAVLVCVALWGACVIAILYGPLR